MFLIETLISTVTAGNLNHQSDFAVKHLNKFKSGTKGTEPDLNITPTMQNEKTIDLPIKTARNLEAHLAARVRSRLRPPPISILRKRGPQVQLKKGRLQLFRLFP